MSMQAVVVTELIGRIVECIMHQNGNHVIQRIIICVPQKLLDNIIYALTGTVLLYHKSMNFIVTSVLVFFVDVHAFYPPLWMSYNATLAGKWVQRTNQTNPSGIIKEHRKPSPGKTNGKTTTHIFYFYK